MENTQLSEEFPDLNQIGVTDYLKIYDVTPATDELPNIIGDSTGSGHSLKEGSSEGLALILRDGKSLLHFVNPSSTYDV